MTQSLLNRFGPPMVRVENALASLRRGQGVLVTDNEDRENEGDLIFAAQTLTTSQMALLIRECSGIVCLCLTEEKIRELKLPMMVENNSSRFQTAFTISIEAAQGGVLERGGHTEAAVDLARMAGLQPCGVLCELTNPDGAMARLPEIILFARKHSLPVCTVDDITTYRRAKERVAA